MMAGAYAEQAALFRAGLLLGLVRGEEVVGWADQVLGAATSPPICRCSVSVC
jgi:hypothetical protein